MTARQALAAGTALALAALIAACFGGTAHAERDTPPAGTPRRHRRRRPAAAPRGPDTNPAGEVRTVSEALVNDWRNRATCRDPGMDPGLWFASPASQPDDVRLAKAVCRRCPVANPCLLEALNHGNALEGIWGATTRSERRRLRRRQRSLAREAVPA